MSDLSELFTRDPLSLTTADIDLIIARYREARAQFNLGLASAPKKPRPKASKITNLDDILGDM